jgi:aspartyl-tRNA(Asn)/glutamyl-tRNA(Gln) amidotransferase subunit A
MNDHELAYLDIATLGQHYRQRICSPVEATQAIIARIRRLDVQLNSFITLLEEPALVQARQAETDLFAGRDRGPLHGIPLSLKDLIDTAGIRTTAASRLWRDRIPTETATVATRLAQAGAILLGKCNLLEFAYGNVHPDFGQCNNPWDTGRTSGGSSSGSAASVAAGLGWGSIGTDTGGSIRIPAAYCGVVGLKPTYGRVSVHGVCPLSRSLDHVGPLARTVADAALLLQAIAGYDPLDPTSLPEPVPDYLAGIGAGVRGLRIGIVREHMAADLPGFVGDAIMSAIRELERAGASVREVSIPGLASADDLLMPALTRMQLEQGLAIRAVDYLQAHQQRNQLRAEMLAALREVDILVSATAPWEALAEDPPVDGGQEGAAEARRTAPYNLTGLPAISLPCGFGPQGLPLGIHFAAAPLSEGLLLRSAYAYEQAAGWFHSRPPYDAAVEPG